MIFILAVVVTAIALTLAMLDDRGSFPFSWAKLGGYALLAFPWIFGALSLLAAAWEGVSALWR